MTSSLQHIAAAALAALALALGGLAHAGPPDEQARKDLERARQELEKARTELQRATRELARSMAKVERDNPRAQYFEYMTDPDRAVLGVLIPDDMENGEARGVRILAVTPGSGAEKAGLKAGDLITAMNGRELTRDGKRSPQKRMREVMRTLSAGDGVKVEYERDGRRHSVTVTTTAPEPDIAMGPLPFEDFLNSGDFEHFGPMLASPLFKLRSPALRGIELARLDDDLGSYFKTKDGVLVVKAPKDGALKLKSGDVIQKIDGDAVSEPVTVLDKLRSRDEEKTVRIELIRQGRKVEVDGKIPVAQAPHFREHKRRIEIHDEDAGDEDGT